jgi:glycosyltransferase involved in cell wall biosynthesis
MSSISLCMIVKNEEHNLYDCLKSIESVVDEMIIVDTGSSDKTIEIAKSFGATVLEMEWEDDFAKARNLSIKDAKSEWILWMDADDRTPKSSLRHIADLKNRARDCVYSFTIRNEKPNGTGTEFLQARLFPNHKGLTFERPVHEQVMLSALRIGLKMERATDVVVEHHGYADPTELRQKAARNVKILEKNLEIYGNDAVTFVELGDSYNILEDNETALSWYEKTVSLPDAERAFSDVCSQAWMGIGNIANANSDFVRASEAFKKVAQLCPGRVDLFYNLAVTYEKQELFAEAAKTLSKIFTTPKNTVKVGVDYRQVLIRGAMKMVRNLLKTEDEAELEKWMNIFLEKLGERQEIQNLAGIVWYRLGKIIESLRAYEKSLSILKEGNVDAFIGLTLIYVMAEQEDKALETVTTGCSYFAYSCRFMLFRTLFLDGTESDGLDSFDDDLILAEKRYLLDLFGVEVDY